MMRALFGTLLMYLILKLFLLGVGIGIGFLLHWIVPAIDLGMAALIGLVATGLSIHFFARLFGFRDAYTEEGTEPEVIPPVAYIIDPLPPTPRPRGNRRKRS
jgi:hypothetical protein